MGCCDVGVWQLRDVRMLFSLSLTLGLKARQVDYSGAFVQASIDGEVYCELPVTKVTVFKLF